MERTRHARRGTPYLPLTMVVGLSWYGHVLLPLVMGTSTGVENIMNSEKYQSIIAKNVMMPFESLKFRRKWAYQQDNDPSNTIKLPKDWLVQKGWKV